MSNWRKEWLTFDRKDRVAIPFLFLIIFSLIVALGYWDEWNKKEFNRNNQQVILPVKDSLKKKEIKDSDKEDYHDRSDNYTEKYNKQSDPEITYFKFNPNKISVDSFALLGFSQKESEAFINFRSSGVTFQEPKDILQSFVVTQNDFDRLQDYIVLNGKQSKINQEKPREKFNGTIEVNQAKAGDLKKIYGIGPTYAKRIVKFRDALGGFVTKKQLNEVYGIQDSTYDLIKPYIKVNPSKVEKIDINKASKKELASHPYIEYHIANSIVNYRKQHGDFDQLKEIKNLHLINDQLYAKIKSYIVIE